MGNSPYCRRVSIARHGGIIHELGEGKNRLGITPYGGWQEAQGIVKRVAGKSVFAE